VWKRDVEREERLWREEGKKRRKEGRKWGEPALRMCAKQRRWRKILVGPRENETQNGPGPLAAVD
jgi:hypothetical protein